VNKITKQNENFLINNKGFEVDFTIEDNIKNFIDNILILKLHKKICDEEDNTEEEDSFQLNKRREQYESKNGSFCNSCKRRVYRNR